LPPQGSAIGFDTGPGNLLLDLWAARHRGVDYDENGAWAASGHVQESLLAAMLQDDYFPRLPPKSTGRDDFNEAWLLSFNPERFAPADVQATLLALTARSIGDAIARHCSAAKAVFACGGGVQNSALMRAIEAQLEGRLLASTVELGIPPDWVEAAAFAWLAKRTMERQPGNLPTVTGARGPRILGAIYPA
jgi:anhydro-N-acetylmuramic acid kinase